VDSPLNAPLRVVHLSVVHQPDDPRIFERECCSLAEAGYEVTYMVPGPPSLAHERRSGVHFLPLPPRPRTRRWLSLAAIVRQLAQVRPHVVHIHDPELLTLFPLLRPWVPRLVYDMHEYDALEVGMKYYVPARLRPLAPRAVAAAQRTLASLADGAVAVVDDQFAVLGRRPRLRLALANYPRFSRFEDAHPLAELAADPRLKLIYIGSLTRHRGIPVTLQVMRQVADAAVLYLGGAFANPAFEREVRALVEPEGAPLHGAVRLLGHLPPPVVPSYLAAADVVWVPALPAGQHARRLVTTKLYEGLAVGLAALVSDLPGRGDVVKAEGCGLAVPPTVEGHLDGVRRLLADRDQVKAMGARGRQAVRERYSWERLAPRLVDFYERLCQGLPSPRPSADTNADQGVA